MAREAYRYRKCSRKKMSKGIALMPSLLLSFWMEQDSTIHPIYIPIPKALLNQFKADAILLYPYEWAKEQATNWLRKDAEQFKKEEREEAELRFSKQRQARGDRS